nr:C-GCAxxG-C-C family protein [uncultured Pseudodesulfovibrio sp.]
MAPCSKDTHLTAQTGATAKELYGNGSMCCSEAVLTVINREFDGGLSQDIVIAISKGFCGGIGDAGCVCGALAGAVMAQSLILGKGPVPTEDEEVRKASKALHDRFLAQYGSICCRDLSKDRDPNSDSKGVCLDYVESATAICADLLLHPKALQEAKDVEDEVISYHTEPFTKDGLKPIRF